MKYITSLLFLLFLFVNPTASSDWQWSQPAIPSNVLHTVHVFDSLNIIAMGDAGIMMLSSDFGQNWSPHYAENITENIYGSHFFDRNNGLIVGEKGLVAMTADAGKSWNRIKLSTKVTLNDVMFLNSRDGIAVGEDGIVIQTSDGGKTWVKIDTNIDAYLKSVHMITPDIFFIVGNFGLILSHNSKVNS